MCRCGESESLHCKTSFENRYYEFDADSLYSLSEYKSSDPQRGIGFLPRRALNVAECEIARAFKVAGSAIEPIAFIVPRKVRQLVDEYVPASSW